MTTTKTHGASWALVALVLVSLVVLTSSCSTDTAAVGAALRHNRMPSTSFGMCGDGCPCQNRGQGFCSDCPSLGLCFYCPHDVFCPADPCDHTVCPEPDPYKCPEDAPVNCGDGNCCPEDYPVCCPGARCTSNDTCDD
jgi:hypothetical protein